MNNFEPQELSAEEQQLALKFLAKLYASRHNGKYTPDQLGPGQEIADWFTANVGTIKSRVSDPDKPGATVEQSVVQRRFDIRDIARWVSWLRATKGALIISSRSPKNPGYAHALNRKEMEPTLAMLRTTRLRLEEIENRILANLEALEKRAEEERQAKLFDDNALSLPDLDEPEEHPTITALKNELGAEQIR